MKTFPSPANSARVGSNLTNPPRVGDQLLGIAERRLNARRQAGVELRRQRDRWIGKAAAKKAAQIITDGRTQFDRVFLDAKGDRAAIAAAKDRTRLSIHRALSKNVPGYAKYRAAQKAYLKRYGPLSEDATGPLYQQGDVHLGDLQLTTDPDVQEFAAPYELFGVEMWGDPLAIADTSFADPDLGLLAQSVRFEHSDDGWSVPVEYNPALYCHAVTVLGVNYVVPRTGRLSCAAVFQNLYNQVTSGVNDRYGFSHAELRADHGILLRVIRSGEWTVFNRLMIQAGLTSFGSDLSYTQSGIQSTAPYTLSLTTQDVFLQGERIQILAGADIVIDSDLDDMSMHVDSVLLWQLRRLRIGVHD